MDRGGVREADGGASRLARGVPEAWRTWSRKTIRVEATITRGYLVFSGGGRFAVRPLDGFAWVYPKRVTTKLDYVLPIWRSHRAIACALGAAEVQKRRTSRA